VRERRDGAVALTDLHLLLNQPPRKLGCSVLCFWTAAYQCIPNAEDRAMLKICDLHATCTSGSARKVVGLCIGGTLGYLHIVHDRHLRPQLRMFLRKPISPSMATTTAGVAFIAAAHVCPQACLGRSKDLPTNSVFKKYAPQCRGHVPPLLSDLQLLHFGPANHTSSDAT
jgi:hypothetical protein